MKGCGAVQALHVRPGIAQRVTGEVRLDGGKPSGLGALGEYAVEGAQQAEEGLLLARIDADLVQAVPAGVERIVVQVDEHPGWDGRPASCWSSQTLGGYGHLVWLW